MVSILLASNEAKHEWMDEGFTSYISSLAENELTGGDNLIHFLDLIECVPCTEQ
jgi:hypothetical protein